MCRQVTLGVRQADVQDYEVGALDPCLTVFDSPLTVIVVV
jgi:hypothetical protein